MWWNDNRQVSFQWQAIDFPTSFSILCIFIAVTVGFEKSNSAFTLLLILQVNWIWMQQVTSSVISDIIPVIYSLIVMQFQTNILFITLERR